MRHALILLFSAMLAAVAVAHPFDDRALMHTNLAIVNDRDLVVTILYNFTGAASSYTEVWKLDANQDGFVTLTERDKRLLALAQERLDNVELKINGKRVKLSIDSRSFQCLDMDHPDRDFRARRLFPRNARGWAMRWGSRQQSRTFPPTAFSQASSALSPWANASRTRRFSSRFMMSE